MLGLVNMVIVPQKQCILVNLRTEPNCLVLLSCQLNEKHEISDLLRSDNFHMLLIKTPEGKIKETTE